MMRQIDFFLPFITKYVRFLINSRLSASWNYMNELDTVECSPWPLKT